MGRIASKQMSQVELARELDDLRARQEAVAGVLLAMTQSGLRLQPILDEIVANAARLCRAEQAFIWLSEGEVFRARAHFGAPPEVVEFEKTHPDRPRMESLVGRVALTKSPVHIADLQADPHYAYPQAGSVALRSLLGVPILVGDRLVGIIGLARRMVQPFDQGEIDLTAMFATQSALAIVNAELFETVERQRTELAGFVSPEVAALVSSDEGARLLAGHRAYISVVYFDLRGFTAFSETAEPEELIEVIGEYHSLAGDLIRETTGTLEHFAGDGLMVFFNDPVPLADHELHAAMLAMAMREKFSDVAELWRKRGHDLALGAGLAVGHATMGRIGFEGRYDYGALGPVTSLAARLSATAAGGQILLSQRAYAALEGHVEAKLVGDLRIKGFSRPANVYELLRVTDRQ
jgi:class 3 adenylate cyclase